MFGYRAVKQEDVGRARFVVWARILVDSSDGVGDESGGKSSRHVDLD